MKQQKQQTHWWPAGFEGRVLAAFVIAALVVAALAATTWKVSQRALEGALWLSHAHEIISRLADTKGYSLQIELSTQNFRISGDPARLVERDAAIAARETALRQIRELTADNPKQQAHWLQMRGVIDERLAISRRSEHLRKTEGAEAANAYVAGAPLAETRERLFQIFREMKDEEHRLLVTREAAWADERDRALTSGVLTLLLLIALLTTVYVMIRRQLRATEAARDAAERANRAKDSFLATMSHEIRTPLGGLLGMLELLALSPLGPEQDETLQTARDSGRSLLRILNDILDWSKIEEGKLELAPQATAIGQLVAEVANTYSHVASANSVTLTTQVDARLAPAHLIDPLRLSQVLNNFVSNAIKFSHRGRVELRAELIERRDGVEEVRFAVQDTGIGIAPEVQRRLFQSYGQASADTARMYGGTGLGLAICRRLADLLDGRIALESVPGQGSTFSITLTLPIARTAAEPAPGRPAERVATAAAKHFVSGGAAADALRVLVVDDNPINRKLLARQLDLLGLRAETAENGQTALPLWRTGRHALVITDCHMPVLDGYALARAIRECEAAEARPRTPVFAWTANALGDEAEKCRAAGMDELLVKSADLAQLKAVLAKWLPADAVPDLVAVPPALMGWSPQSETASMCQSGDSSQTT